MSRGKGLARGGGLRRKGDPKLTEWARRGSAVTIDAHHKAPRSQRPDLKYDLNNGIVLCRDHHDFAHHAGKAEAIALGILITETYEMATRTGRD